MLKKPNYFRKHGLIITPQKNLWWMQTHAMTPTIERLEGSLCKVYFSGRDNQNRSHIGFAVLDLKAPTRVLEYSPEPVLGLGALGCFDDNGVTPASIVKVGSKTHLYYIGWNPGSTVRMHLFGGLAISSDGGKTFQRYSKAPIIERNRVDPFLNTAPYVMHENGRWSMYYVSGTEWVHKDLPRYNIKYASSLDGLTWDRQGHVCIDYSSAEENALARPNVVREGGVYKMWFAHKGTAYRLGYAESLDGLHWSRRDEYAGLEPSPPGAWDSEMVEYAAVTHHNGRKIMFYNGNNYGDGGVGLAIEE